MEVKLHNNDRVHLRWIRPGMLSIEVHRPMNQRDGHGVCLAGSAYLSGAELTAFLTALQPPAPGQSSLHNESFQPQKGL